MMCNSREENTHEWVEGFVLIHGNPTVGEPIENRDGVSCRERVG